MNEVLVAISHPRGRKWKKPLAELGGEFLGQLRLKNTELSVSLVTDAAIRKLNRAWRKKDKATDVLSFPADPPPKGMPGPRVLGDVVISLDTAVRVAKEDGRDLEAELARYLAHGVLHLLGYDHERSKTEEKKMRALEEKLLGQRGLI